MEVDFEVFDIDSIKNRIQTLEVNLESCQIGEAKIQSAEESIAVYELTINYLKNLILKSHKLQSYSKAYSEKLHEIEIMKTYKAGDNMFIDQCIRAVAMAEQIIKDAA